MRLEGIGLLPLLRAVCSKGTRLWGCKRPQNSLVSCRMWSSLASGLVVAASGKAGKLWAGCAGCGTWPQCMMTAATSSAITCENRQGHQTWLSDKICKSLCCQIRIWPSSFAEMSHMLEHALASHRRDTAHLAAAACLVGKQTYSRCLQHPPWRT